MEKVFKILNKGNKNYLYKQKNNKKSMRHYQKEFQTQGLYKKINDDFDYVDFTITRTSYENMRSIKSEFFNVKETLRELWDVISYQEKHFLIYQKLEPFLETLKSFEYKENRYFITFFDELINAYFDHDMLMFENDAYRKYLYDISKIVVKNNPYGIIPIQSGFAQMDFIVGDDDLYVMYNMEMKRFYFYDHGHKSTIGVSRVLNNEEIVDIALLIKSKNTKGLVDYLIEHEVGSVKQIKKLAKIQRKLEK